MMNLDNYLTANTTTLDRAQQDQKLCLEKEFPIF